MRSNMCVRCNKGMPWSAAGAFCNTCLANKHTRSEDMKSIFATILGVLLLLAMAACFVYVCSDLWETSDVDKIEPGGYNFEVVPQGQVWSVDKRPANTVYAKVRYV